MAPTNKHKIVRMSFDTFLEKFIPTADNFDEDFPQDDVRDISWILNKYCTSALKDANGNHDVADLLVLRSLVSAVVSLTMSSRLAIDRVPVRRTCPCSGSSPSPGWSPSWW